MGCRGRAWPWTGRPFELQQRGVSGEMCSVEHHPSLSPSPYSNTRILNQPSPTALSCKGQGDIDDEGKRGARVLAQLPREGFKTAG